jgi:hypothetical protein
VVNAPNLRGGCSVALSRNVEYCVTGLMCFVADAGGICEKWELEAWK